MVSFFLRSFEQGSQVGSTRLRIRRFRQCGTDCRPVSSRFQPRVQRQSMKYALYVVTEGFWLRFRVFFDPIVLFSSFGFFFNTASFELLVVGLFRCARLGA